jgi:hypothetical protein
MQMQIHPDPLLRRDSVAHGGLLERDGCEQPKNPLGNPRERRPRSVMASPT